MSEDVEQFLSRYKPEIRTLALQARELVQLVLPHAAEQVQTGHNVISYGAGLKMGEQIVYIAPFKGWVNLGFFRGTELPDPEGLLEGSGKMLRHVKLRKVAELEDPALRALLEAARARQRRQATRG